MRNLEQEKKALRKELSSTLDKVKKYADERGLDPLEVLTKVFQAHVEEFPWVKGVIQDLRAQT